MAVTAPTIPTETVGLPIWTAYVTVIGIFVFVLVLAAVSL